MGGSFEEPLLGSLGPCRGYVRGYTGNYPPPKKIKKKKKQGRSGKMVGLGREGRRFSTQAGCMQWLRGLGSPKDPQPKQGKKSAISAFVILYKCPPRQIQRKGACIHMTTAFVEAVVNSESILILSWSKELIAKKLAQTDPYIQPHVHPTHGPNYSP